VDILGAHFDKLPERKRPCYTPRQRFQILELRTSWAGPRFVNHTWMMDATLVQAFLNGQ
jgi:hypothetical protein